MEVREWGALWGPGTSPGELEEMVSGGEKGERGGEGLEPGRQWRAVSPGFWWAQGGCLRGSQLTQSGEHGLYGAERENQVDLAALLRSSPEGPGPSPKETVVPSHLLGAQFSGVTAVLIHQCAWVSTPQVRQAFHSPQAWRSG